MIDYLSHLTARRLGMGEIVRPRLAPLFAPNEQAAGFPIEDGFSERIPSHFEGEQALRSSSSPPAATTEPQASHRRPAVSPQGGRFEAAAPPRAPSQLDRETAPTEARLSSNDQGRRAAGIARGTGAELPRAPDVAPVAPAGLSPSAGEDMEERSAAISVGTVKVFPVSAGAQEFRGARPASNGQSAADGVSSPNAGPPRGRPEGEAPDEAKIAHRGERGGPGMRLEIGASDRLREAEVAEERRALVARQKMASIALQRPVERADVEAQRSPSEGLGTTTAPIIHVTIGRIEVRAAPGAPAPARRAAKAPPSAPLSLSDYLKQRNEGGR